MRAEDTTEPVDGHRPLPSVDIPLLREERRATRARQVAAAVTVGMAVLGGAVALFLTRALPSGEGAEAEPTTAPPSPPEGDDAPSAVAQEALDDAVLDEAVLDEEGDGPAITGSDLPITPGAVERHTFTFGRAPTFRHALANGGFERDDTATLEAALDGVLDFRRCRPDHRMVVERDTEGRIVLFEYHPGPTEYVQVTRGGDGALRGERVEVPRERKRVATAARVRSSLGDALDRAGLGRSLVGLFVSVFEGRVDFSADTREGDHFRIIVDEEHIDGEFLRYGTAHALEYVGARTGTVRAFWYEPKGGLGDHYDETGRAMQGGWLRTPCRYDRISSRFNPRRMHPILKRVVPHNGVDYAAGTGTPVRAAADGTITFAAPKGANGNLVSIRHADGYETLYAHLHGFAKGIRSGEKVKQRQVIGYVGTTGRSTGPHLHFALKHHGRFLDPLEVINGPGRKLPAREMSSFKQRMRRLEQELAEIRVGGRVIRSDVN
jgi:murein DD-endopeptidase MepM/ murein hydrolase activator NlpD